MYKECKSKLYICGYVRRTWQCSKYKYYIDNMEQVSTDYKQVVDYEEAMKE